MHAFELKEILEGLPPDLDVSSIKLGSDIKQRWFRGYTIVINTKAYSARDNPFDNDEWAPYELKYKNTLDTFESFMFKYYRHKTSFDIIIAVAIKNE